MQWTLDEPMGTGEVPSSLAATADGGFVLMAHLYDSSTSITSVQVVRFDADGGVVWETIYDVPRGQGVEVRQVAAAPDGRIGLAGVHFENGATDVDAWIAVLAP